MNLPGLLNLVASVDISRSASKLANMEPTQTADGLAKHIVREVKAEMARKGMSQEALGALIGWDQRRVSRRLTGEVPFGVAELGQVADALGVSVMQLIPTEVRAK